MEPHALTAARGGARRWLRWSWAPVLVLALLVLLVMGVLRSPGHPGRGSAAPAFTAPRLDGRGTLSLDAFRGRPVVLNFWASWCGPCKSEAPLLEGAYRRYRGRVAFVGVDVNDARSDARAFVRRHGITYPNVFDADGSIYRDYGLTGQPETFFIAPDGRIAAHVPGALYRGLLEHELQRLTR